jgi:hypothetical protein
VFKRKSDEKGVPPMFKSEVIINDCNAEFLVTCYENLPRRKVWDKTMKSVEIIATVHEGLKVMRVVTEPVAGGIISSREFVDALSTKHVVSDQIHRYESVSQFIEIKGITQTKGTVRGKNYACGMMIEDLKNEKGEFINQAKITNIYAFEIGGWVPSKAVHAGAVGSMYDMAKHLKKHVETNKAELLKH